MIRLMGISLISMKGNELMQFFICNPNPAQTKMSFEPRRHQGTKEHKDLLLFCVCSKKLFAPSCLRVFMVQKQPMINATYPVILP